MTLTEITCDAPGCPHQFQAVDRPAFIAAQEFGWFVGDPTLCPTHATEGADRVLAAVDAEWSGWGAYGRHSVHNVTDRVPPGEPFIGDPMTFARAYFEEYAPIRRIGRQACRGCTVVRHPRVTVAELREAINA